MRDILGESLKNLKRMRMQKNRLYTMLLVLSLIVSVNVFWLLRQPGLTLAGDAACGIPEHTHDEDCFTRVCICELSEEAHIHTEACYTTQLTEKQERTSLVCTRTEDPHVHEESCYTTKLTEATETLQLICKESTEPHSHSDSCYEVQYPQAQEVSRLVCTETDELHDHTGSCYQTQIIEAEPIRQLVCTQAGVVSHTHADGCYERITTAPVEETVLNCQISSVPHNHTETCYATEVIEASEEQVLTCGLSETAHVHEDGCYTRELHCDAQEHVHGIECYCDDTADVETLLDWQNMFAAYPYTGDLRRDLVGIAKTQVGYCESTRNFEVGSDGIRRGYTRYGAWYGTPYRDWSAAFVSFCLNYAGADPTQTPGNIGANAMAELWKNQGRFAPAGEYVPFAGDLVFFTNNTVAIVSEVQSATFYAIRGDADDAVSTVCLLLNDASIAGWGMTAVSEEEPVPDPTDALTQDPAENTASELTWDALLDISNGPVFFLLTDGETLPLMRTYSMRTARTITDLMTYLNQVGGNLKFSLYTSDNVMLHPDENNNYTVDPNVGYKLHMRINSLYGLLPGTYRYQLPQGLIVTAGNGTFQMTDKTTGETIEVGDWNVTADGLITLNFNGNMENQSNVSIPATMGIQFSLQDEPIYFDGNVTVTVNPPPDIEDPTVLKKWGIQGYEANAEGKTDRSKIYWSIEITGHADSQLPGSVLSDKVVNGEWIANHRYTESDIAAGLRFDVCDPNGNWHSWTVHQGDLNLEWTESGWSYTIPQTVICGDGEELTLGNHGWVYLVNYSSTPDPEDFNGSLTYANQVTVDYQSFDGYVKFQHGEVQGEIEKSGSFQADAAGGSFHWEISAIIPGYQQGEFAKFWDITDTMNLYNSSGTWLALLTNDANRASVTATHNGNTVTVHRPWEAEDSDPYAWHISWSDRNNPQQIANVRGIALLCRCACTEESCPWWIPTGCGSKPWVEKDDGSWYLEENFCRCWTKEGNTEFNITYETTDLAIIEAYGGVNNQLRNYAELFYIQNGDESQPVSAGRKLASVTVPGLFKKELTQDFNGYTAHYQITVNEAKLSLTDGSALVIHDEMTETLAFISGSLVITAEDASGNTSTLRQDTDYTITYDGTGNQTDTNNNKVHVLDITILHPQPVRYIIDYDATLIIPRQRDNGIAYSNSASITLWGQTIESSSQGDPYTDFGISGESYTVKLNKACATTGKALEGATFGLFNAQGGQMAVGTTAENGELSFRTNIVQGIIFREHELYYMQELQAPTGYQLDSTRHWFCFCTSQADTCAECTAVMADTTALRIPYDQIGIMDVTNEIMNYDLPATGGFGTFPVMLVSVMFILAPLVYASVQRRKHERRAD